MSSFDYRALAACARREAKMREIVYPKRVAEGKMTIGAMEDEIGKMQAIAEHFDHLATRHAFRGRSENIG